MTINIQILTLSKLNKLPLSIRRDVIFYAPLVDSLDYMGIEPATFARAGASMATWRDGASHAVAANVPRFEYSGETQLGLAIDTVTLAESLQYPTANKLNDANTLIWIEEGNAKSTPTDANPFNASGAWAGNNNVHVRHVVKFKRLLSAEEIVVVKNILL